MVGFEEWNAVIQLFGYTTCSLKMDEALSFAWENLNSGHHKVLFEIQWNKKLEHYFLNAGAYDHEQEVLLFDGTKLQVEDVYDPSVEG